MRTKGFTSITLPSCSRRTQNAPHITGDEIRDLEALLCTKSPVDVVAVLGMGDKDNTVWHVRKPGRSLIAPQMRALQSNNGAFTQSCHAELLISEATL